MVAFFEGKDIKMYDLALNQALEQIQGNIQWIEVCGINYECMSR
jgi:hypothetical protein